MKTKIATALSLVGVLSAGSAAALVNTQILDGGAGSADASDVLTSSTIEPSPSTSDEPAPSTSDAASTTTTVVSTTEPDTTVVVTTPSTTSAPSQFLTTFNVGEAGTVTVDVVDGKVVLVDAVPAAGWELRKAEEDDDEVEVKFTNATTLVEFKVRFRDGQLVPSVESKALGAGSTSTTVAGGNTSTTIDDDDDDETENTIDDDDEDEDHDDDSDHDDDDHDDDDGDDDGGDDHDDD